MGIHLTNADWALILQLEIQFDPLVPKILLQGQRPVPYQRGPAALVAGRTKKAGRAESPTHLCSRRWMQFADGTGFQPFSVSASSRCFAHAQIDGLGPSLVWHGPLALKTKTLIGDSCHQKCHSTIDLRVICVPESNFNCSTKWHLISNVVPDLVRASSQ